MPIRYLNNNGQPLYPSVDFYSGIIYQAIGFPMPMFPVLFSISRTVGWMAQWREMITDEEQRTARPPQVYIGPGPRDYRPSGLRGVHCRSCPHADDRGPV